MHAFTVTGLPIGKAITGYPEARPSDAETLATRSGRITKLRVALHRPTS